MMHARLSGIDLAQSRMVLKHKASHIILSIICFSFY